MFKTGVLNRKMTELFEGKVTTFYGVRRNESAIRSNYNRTEEKTESVKIANNRMCAPILYWNDLEVWLYILANKIDFNQAYTRGYNRVGCYTCPNASIHQEMLERIYCPKEFSKWTDVLFDFATQCGISNPDDYVKLGSWKHRVGGNGTNAAHTVKVKSANCTTEENGRSYELLKDIDLGFYDLFIPFGKVIDGRKLINEKLILHLKTNEPIVSLQPLESRKIKIVTLNAKYPHQLHSRLKYQIVKWNACQKCLKCESLCKYGAISMCPKKYEVNEKKCTKCQVCVNPKYLEGGCLMTRYLRTKKEAV